MNSKTYQISQSRLIGQVKISGAKNSALKLLTASLLTNEKVELYNFPNNILDVQVHLEMLEVLGKKCLCNEDSLTINQREKSPIMDLLWQKRSIRITLLVLGALVARFGSGRVPLPGGCKIGERKYDLHVMLLEKLGAKVWEEESYLCAEAKDGLKGADIHLPIRSTGATENTIISATLAEGTTSIWNPHIRPEILDLIAMLNKMGAKITVYGQKCIVVEGVEGLSGVELNPAYAG